MSDYTWAAAEIDKLNVKIERLREELEQTVGDREDRIQSQAAEIERLRGVIDAMTTEAHAVYKPELDAKDAEIEQLRLRIEQLEADLDGFVHGSL